MRAVEASVRKLSLHEAAKLGDLARVKALVDSGCDVNEEDDFGLSAEDLAARAGHLEAILFCWTPEQYEIACGF